MTSAPQPLGLLTYRWSNNIKSVMLLAAFPCILVAIVAAFFWSISFFSQTPAGYVDPLIVESWLGYYNASTSVFDFVSLMTQDYVVIISVIASLWIVIGLLFHDGMFRAATHAKPIARTENPDLYNLLENLCISRGLRPPKLYIMDTPVNNAFASGMTPSTYAITVTRGLLESLNKDEVEAVLAHELSHITNNDVRLMVVTVLFTGMLSFFAEALWRGIRHVELDKRGGRLGILALLIAAVIFSVGYFISTLFRFALSRRREFLADAGSVALTKRPECLISALQKISGHAALPGVPSGIQAMMIENPPSFLHLFDSHPLIEARISVLRRLGGQIEGGASIIPKT